MGQRGNQFNAVFTFNGKAIHLFPKSGEPDLLSLFINYKLNSSIDFADNQVNADTVLAPYQLTMFKDELGNAMVMYQPSDGMKQIIRASDLVTLDAEGNPQINSKNPEVELFLDFLESKFHSVSTEALLPNSGLSREDGKFFVPAGLNYKTGEVVLSKDSYDSYEDYVMDSGAVDTSVRMHEGKPLIINRYFAFDNKATVAKGAPKKGPAKEKPSNKAEEKAPPGKGVTKEKTAEAPKKAPGNKPPVSGAKKGKAPLPKGMMKDGLYILDKSEDTKASIFSAQLMSAFIGFYTYVPQTTVPIKSDLNTKLYVATKNTGSTLQADNYQFALSFGLVNGKLQVVELESNPMYENHMSTLIKELNSGLRNLPQEMTDVLTYEDITSLLKMLYNEKRTEMAHDKSLTFYSLSKPNEVGEVEFIGHIPDPKSAPEAVKIISEQEALKEPPLKCV